MEPPAALDGRTRVSGDQRAVDTAELLALATDIAAAASAILIDGLTRTRTSVDTKTTGTDMVTEMDRASERLIVESILAVRPEDAILGEEGTDRHGSSGVRWIVDPIDGTTNYLYGHPGFAVSIAAEVDGDRVVEFKEKPQTGEGWLNGGVFVFEPEIFDYLSCDDVILEAEPLENLAKDGELMSFKHGGFWQCIDTLRDKQLLEHM